MVVTNYESLRCVMSVGLRKLFESWIDSIEELEEKEFDEVDVAWVFMVLEFKTYKTWKGMT